MAKLDQEPRLPGQSPALVEWARRVAQLLNLHDDLKAPIDSPAFTGTPTAPTPPSSDNSTRIATTAWAKLGFVALLASTGYVKFPTWLGGFVIQWGATLTSAGGETSITFPIAFPTTATIAVATVPSNAVGWVATINGIVTTGMTTSSWSGGTRQVAVVYWIALGY